MNNNPLVLKIAEGYFDCARENNKVSLYQEELNFFIWNLKKNPELQEYLSSPFNNYNDKCASIDSLFKGCLLDETLTFLKLLLKRDLFGYILEVKQVYDNLSNKINNKVEGTIFSPYKIDEEKIMQIESIFSNKLSKEVILKIQIDKSIIAGIRILIEDKVYEYSLNSRLDEIEDNLLNK